MKCMNYTLNEFATQATKEFAKIEIIGRSGSF